MTKTKFITIKISNDFKVKILEELVERQKKSEKTFSQTDFLIELLENYFREKEAKGKEEADAS